MNWDKYIKEFEKVVDATNRTAPYDQLAYQEYAKLNLSRVNRWLKKDIFSEETKSTFASISSPQKWILITEAWCGDAAHIAPVLYKLSGLSDLIEFEIQLRDSDSEIDNYLTNGGKAIPKLVVRDENGKDLFNWGPRPAECQVMVVEMKTMDLSNQDKNMRIQQWYNMDKGAGIQKEIVEQLLG